MLNFRRCFAFVRPMLAVSAGSAALLLAGCAIEPMTQTASPASVISGNVHGGQEPIGGATVSFYETAATGVATNGVYVPATPLTALGSTTTSAGGSFNFTKTLTCSSASDYVYAVASGGTAATNSAVNPNILLMAAVGPCTSFGASTSVNINELTTIAAAYALSGFTSLSGSAVSVTGSATNYVTATQSGSSAAGLAHAFLNAANLVNATTGVANTAPTGNSGAVVPQALINALGNSLQACVNSTGGSASTFSTPTPPTASTGATATLAFLSSTNTTNATVSVSVGGGSAQTTTMTGVTAATFTTAFNTAFQTALGVTATNVSGSGTVTIAGPTGTTNTLSFTGSTFTSGTVDDGSTCGTLFAAATPVGGATPTNTLQVALNMAHYPTHNAATIFNLGPAAAAFNPSISAAPLDMSISIVYPKYNATTNGVSTCPSSAGPYTNGLCYPYSLALDSFDNVYVMNSNASNTTESNIVAYSSAGTPLWSTATDTVNTSPKYIAADGLGNIFMVNNASGATTENIVEYAASSGAVETTITAAAGLPWGIAVDSSNNLWYSIAAKGATQNLFELTYQSPNTYSQATFGTTPNNAAAAQDAYAVVIDPSGNVWESSYLSTGTSSPSVFPYTAAVTSPATAAYNTPEVTAAVASGNSSYGLVVDASGNGWITNSAGLYKLTASGSGTTFSISAGTLIPYTPAGGTASLRYMSIDGNGTLWTVDNNTSYSLILGYSTTASSPSFIRIKPCTVASGACVTPTSSTNTVYGPRYGQPDSTGSLWVASSTNGTVQQVIGLAAPTWPLLAVLKPGLMP
jgi:hypothetical protein